MTQTKTTNVPISSQNDHLTDNRGGNKEEYQYLNILRNIFKFGNKRRDRTGTGNTSLFGVQMRFSLRDNSFPLLTTKRVFYRGIAEELFWFIRGSTNAKELQDRDVHIWDGNSSREYLDSIGLNQHEVGDLGPVYGFQWRHYGAQYVDMNTDYSGQGVDQLAIVIENIKKRPEDRRLIMTAWNPRDIPFMALPPCHCICQFYVADGELSCHMYQRSADMGLGVPFNIGSFSLLTIMIAHVTGLRPGEFVHTIGDAHIYQLHNDALKLQLQRKPRPFPQIYIKGEVNNIEDFKFDNFELKGYNPHKKIEMELAI
jgi:thymidylate synthase